MNIKKQILKMKSHITKSSKFIVILLQILLINLGIIIPTDTYSAEVVQKNTRISEIQEIQGMKITNYKTEINDDKPKNIKKKDNKAWLILLIGIPVIIASIYLTFGIGWLALLFAWEDAFPIMGLLTLILGIPSVALVSIFSLKAIIKKYFKKRNNSIKKKEKLSKNERRTMWTILSLISASAVIIASFLAFFLSKNSCCIY